ncbi:TPA: hypothetical protein HA338_06460 [Methanosarcina acetivorans]|nr:hypothetical protein [Methanosarcina acetivorans]HIH93683.1 hypothetical protein [Methanosarcina acetivorans]
MGFGIKIKDEELRILDHLEYNPAVVFKQPYGGYLFFLVGGADDEILSWLLKKIVILDSLTSKHVAYAIFARNFKFKMHIPVMWDSYKWNRDIKSNKQTDLSIEEIKSFYSVTELVKSGKCGWVFDGDEINAITYGTDEIARSFGVMGDLPCMLIFDSIPKRNYEVFHLNQNNLQALIPILRRSIQSLVKRPTYISHMQTIKIVTQLQLERSRIQSLKYDEYDEEKELSIIREQYTKPINRLRIKIRSALKNGNVYKVISAFSDYSNESNIETHIINEVIEASKINKDILSTLFRTIYRLQTYSTNYKWPLEEPWRSKYVNVYRKYVRTLQSDLSVNPDLATPDQCIKITEILISLQSKIIEKIIDPLPYDPTNETTVQKLVDDKKVEICKRNEELNRRKLEIESQLENYINQLYEQDQPSFIECVTREIKKERIKSTTKKLHDSAIMYADSWLNPETIIDFLKVIMTR